MSAGSVVRQLAIHKLPSIETHITSEGTLFFPNFQHHSLDHNFQKKIAPLGNIQRVIISVIEISLPLNDQ